MLATLKTESNHVKPLKELLVEELRDLLHAEGQLVAALPKMAAAAHHPKLQEAFLKHLQQTEGHVERLKTAFEPFPRLGRTCREFKDGLGSQAPNRTKRR